MMEPAVYKTNRYRWVVLSAFMFIVAMNQLLWITFAPITADAARYYHVSEMHIGLLSMCFMLVYIVISLPASWVIDTYGIHKGIGTGALLTGLFGLLRGYASTNFNLLLVSQIGIAVGQPFLLNAITKLAANWFPMEERGTASGLSSLAMYVGLFAGMSVTPYLTKLVGIHHMLSIYGTCSMLGALLFIVIARERTQAVPGMIGQEERFLALDGLKDTLRNKGFYLLMFIFFIGLGVFNSVATWIEEILKPRGFTATQAGNTGGTMILGGIIGAIVMPWLSDYFKKRIPFIITAILGATIGLAGITFASSYTVLLTSGLILGFFLLSAGPIGFQYGAEITFPVSEGTSNGLLLLMGQISGIAFILILNSFKSVRSGSMTKPMVILIMLMLICLAVSTRLKESSLLKNNMREKS